MSLRSPEEELRDKARGAIEALEADAFRRGHEEGLAVARKIRDWLTRQPDRKWQAEVRAWADEEIARARARIEGRTE